MIEIDEIVVIEMVERSFNDGTIATAKSIKELAPDCESVDDIVVLCDMIIDARNTYEGCN